MKVVILYDTFFGNTEKVAKMIESYFKEESDMFNITEKIDITPYDLIIVGSPTRGFMPTKPILDFVKQIELSDHQKIAFFDTRMDQTVVKPRFLRLMMKWFGFSNDSLEKIANKKSLHLVQPSGAFYVSESDGPLYETTTESVQKWVNIIKENMEKRL